MSDKDTNRNGGAMAVAPTRQRSASYPRQNLQQAEKLAWTIFKEGPRNCDQDRVAQAIKYKSAANGAFVALRSSASQFGLIDFSGGRLSVSEQWIGVFHAEDERSTRQARQEAMRKPDLYRQLLEQLKDSQLPSVDKLARELHLNQKYGILKDAATVAAQTFIESASYAGMLDDRLFLRLDGLETSPNVTDEVRDGANTGETATARGQHQQPHSSATDHQDPALAVPTSLADDLDRIEIRLLNGKRAFLFVPVPLPFGEKERLKKYIDLLLEEERDVASASSNTSSTGLTASDS